MNQLIVIVVSTAQKDHHIPSFVQQELIKASQGKNHVLIVHEDSTVRKDQHNLHHFLALLVTTVQLKLGTKINILAQLDITCPKKVTTTA